LNEAAEAFLSAVSNTDSPLIAAEAAAYGYRTLRVTEAAARIPSRTLGDLCAHMLSVARAGALAEWSTTWSGVHLATAEAYAAQIALEAGIDEWQIAFERAGPFGRYTALRPGLELAHAQLRHGARATGKERLISAIYDAHEMGARWFEDQAVAIARGSRVALPGVDRPPGPLSVLTPREREVLDLLATGATNHAIADALFITQKTASIHVGNILLKLGVSNRGQAAAIATSIRHSNPK
jgi:DNA-binding CsgD family transcriptional regulator